MPAVVARHDRGEADGRVEAVERSARALRTPAEGRHRHVADVLERLEPSDHAVGDLAGQLHHPRAVGGDVDLRRRLRQLHVEVEVPDGEDLALVRDQLAGERRAENRDEVAHRRDRPAVDLPVPALDVAAGLHAQAEHQPPSRQLMQRRRLQRHRHRRPRPDSDDARRDLHSRRSQSGGRRGPEGIAERDLREPAAPEAGALRAGREIDRQCRRQRGQEQPDAVVVSHGAAG